MRRFCFQGIVSPRERLSHRARSHLVKQHIKCISCMTTVSNKTVRHILRTQQPVITDIQLKSNIIHIK